MKEIDAIKAALLARVPFVGSLILKCRIELDENLEYPAATNARRTIYVNPKLLQQMKPYEQLFVLAHETLHLALLSHTRLGSRDPDLWNIATDCVINFLLNSSGLQGPEGIVTPKLVAHLTGVREHDIRQMSADQIYNLLMTHTNSRIEQHGCEFHRRVRERGDEEGDTSGDEVDKEIEEFWRRSVAEAINFAKSIGKLPAGAEVLFEILKPRVDWRTLLRQAILQGPGLQVLSTWRRPHRKMPGDMPGYVRLSVNNVWCLVDTSGSMLGNHLNQAMTEIFSIAKSLNARVQIIAWDSDAYLTSFSELRTKMVVRGGGGTVIQPALTLLTSKMKANDIIVILTDGLIFDIRNGAVQEMLENITRRAASAVFASTVTLPSLPPGWRGVLII